MKKKSRLIWMSHVLDKSTPFYGGEGRFISTQSRSVSRGDSCNCSDLAFPAHAGTHVDAPYHFIPKGKKVEDFPPDFWFFRKPKVVEVKVNNENTISTAEFRGKLSPSKSVDLLLIKTGFEKIRKTEKYSKASPVFSPDLAPFFLKMFPNLRAVGIDCISISSYSNRETGRLAHKAFLGAGLVLFEDISLASPKKADVLLGVQAFPLRFAGGDGAPCTIVGEIG